MPDPSMEFYHLCFVVQDLEAAMDDLTNTVGTVWQTPKDGLLGEWRYRIAFSNLAPYFELIEGPPGSPWDASQGSRFHHLGYWTDDIASAQDSLLDAGADASFDACPMGRPFSYHWLDSIGANLELVDRSIQKSFNAARRSRQQ